MVVYKLKNSAILDSGATHHIFNELSRFLNFRRADVGDYVWAGDRKLPVLGYGDIDIQVRNSLGQLRVLHLKDVLYVPTLATNVVSLRELKRNGYYWDTRPVITIIRRNSGA
jgi:hypothetical protein